MKTPSLLPREKWRPEVHSLLTDDGMQRARRAAGGDPDRAAACVAAAAREPARSPALAFVPSLQIPLVNLHLVSTIWCCDSPCLPQSRIASSLAGLQQLWSSQPRTSRTSSSLQKRTRLCCTRRGRRRTLCLPALRLPLRCQPDPSCVLPRPGFSSPEKRRMMRQKRCGIS